MKLTADQLRHFTDEGWLLVEDMFDVERDFGPLFDDYCAIADGLAASLQADQAVDVSYAREGSFNDKMLALARWTGGCESQPFDISLPQAGVRDDTPMYLGAPAFRLLRHERLLDIVEQFVGSEIYSNPVQHIRVKVPESLVADEFRSLGRRTPWHQDNGVITDEADDSNILTVWAPITDATIEDGCLGILPRSHAAGLKPHCPRRLGISLADKFVDRGRMLPIPMRAGSVLFLTKHTMHCSLPNRSGRIRWSFDLRYQPIGEPTGRPYFPGFVARSRSNPSSELHDPKAWAESWRVARARLAAEPDPQYNRWRIDAPWCA